MDRKRKILYLITKGNWGGAQKYVHDLAVSLPADRFDAAVAFGDPGALQQKLEAVGVRTIPLPRLGRDVRPIDDLLVFFDLIKLCRAERPDIVHLNSTKIGGLGALAARFAGVPKIIFTAHGWAFNEDRPLWQKEVIRFLHWITVLLCHETVVIARREFDQMATLPFARRRLILIYNGVRPIAFKSRNEAREELATLDSRLDPGRTWIGTISELHANKGLDYALEAVAAIGGDTQFVIIGAGEERQNLQSLIKELGLEGRAVLLGAVADAGTYLKAFDVFTLTSRKEGLPYALLEAGQAGLSAVATQVGGIPEIMDPASGILIEPKNAEEITRSLRLLLDEPETRTSLGQALKRRVEEAFSFDRMLERTIALYLTAGR